MIRVALGYPDAFARGNFVNTELIKEKWRIRKTISRVQLQANIFLANPVHIKLFPCKLQR